LKVYRVTGEIRKPNLKTSFRREILAAKPEHAKEKVYAEFGSRHRAKRFQIIIAGVEEVPAEEIKNPLLKKLVLGEKEVGKQG
jgi:large subunit ribosomal protein LX